MFKLFRRRKVRTSVMYGAFQKLGQVVERKQRKAADYLNQKTATLSRRQAVTGLIIFCLMFGGSSAFTIWHSLSSPGSAIKIQSMSVSRHSMTPVNDARMRVELTSSEMESIRLFRRYLDSLQLTRSGRMIYDSIVRVRPGLFDSLAFIEQAYHEQLKTNEDGKEK
ncbi:hypothetical protein [Niabella aurantiaca]|uniref:hypothetical protein n=1 Tax=Niabella aurantiaca TaxID=379900 RepID=UPI0012F76EE3|nr:hypothetical protein [Niabella aurantiaca]